MSRFRWPRILALVFLMITLLVPVHAVAAKSSDSAFGTGLGARQAAFEAKYGKPVSTKGADDFNIGTHYDISGYKSVYVFWRNGVAAHIVLNARSGWPGTKAGDIVVRWIPTDAQNTGAGGGANTAGQQWVTTFGHSDALARRFSAKTYQEYEVEGKQGDFRVAMIKSATNANEFATIDIAIGKDVVIKQASGSNTAQADTSTDKQQASRDDATTGSNANAGDAGAQYLTDMRRNMNDLGKGMNTFITIMKQDTISQDDVDTLNSVAKQWTDAYRAAKQAKAPQGFAKFQQQYGELTNDLNGAAQSLNAYLSSRGEDKAALKDLGIDYNNAADAYNALSDELSVVGY